MDRPPVTKLTTEILLKVFELLSQDSDAALVASILCCKQWRPTAESVLYGDVFLNTDRLARFLDSYQSDRQIRSLTLVMDPVPVNPYDPTLAIQTATARLKALQQLGSRINKMALVSLSITVDFPLPYTASPELCAIVNGLPNSCACLEIDIKHSSFILDSRADLQSQPTTTRTITTPPPPHMCDAIRMILPQLEHVRLRLPLLCAALFGAATKTKSNAQDSGFEAVRATNLRSCLINLSLREPTGPSSSGSCAASCESGLIPHIGVMHDFPSALPPLLPVLQDFAHVNQTRLERLRIIDVLTRDPSTPNSWAAWVRRDVLSNTSVPIPVANIGGLFNDAWLARIPTDSGRAEDWLSSPGRLEGHAEGCFWNRTTRGVRLATSMLREYDHVPGPLTKELFLKKNRLTCMLWRNEDVTGKKLLPEAPGPLMELWDLTETTPIGWKRGNWDGSPMVQDR